MDVLFLLLVKFQLWFLSGYKLPEPLNNILRLQEIFLIFAKQSKFNIHEVRIFKLLTKT